MLIREETEKNEHQMLSKFASFSDESRGRDREEAPCDLRTIYQRDRDRILHCKSFRRLKHKTQVFLAPDGDHYRTRLTHTLEVAQIARTIARSIRANEDLAEAISLGHDLGHTPFGHAGERALSQVIGRPFRHAEQSVRVVEKLEHEGDGLNLSWEVRDGILNHQTSSRPSTIEGEIVRISDKIAYINHDIDDAIRAGILNDDDLPEMCTYIIGHSTRERINNLILDVVTESREQPHIAQSAAFEEALFNMRRFMFESVYTNPVAKGEEGKAIEVVKMLYGYYFNQPDGLPEEYRLMLAKGEAKDVVVCDYIAGMTDNYAIEKFQEIFIPQSWNEYRK